MSGKKRRGSITERIRSGSVTRRDVVRRLAELAYGRVNDCVRLAVEDMPCLEELDLSLLSEVKRNEKGKVEIKLVDRLQVLEQLARMTGEEKGDLSGFLQAIQNGDET